MNGRDLTLGLVAGLAVAGLARSRGSRSVPLVAPVDLETLKAIYLSWRDGSGGFEKDACVFRVNGGPVLPFGQMSLAISDNCTWHDLLGSARGSEEPGELTRYEQEELKTRLHRALLDAADFFNALSFPLPVYRGLRNDGRDARGAGIRLQDAGKHWTPNRVIAQRFASGQHNAAAQAQGDRITSAVLAGVIASPEDIDWVNTLIGYLRYTWREDEEHVEEQVVSQHVHSVRRLG